jgi:N-acetyl-anhydromuramyl-L-alanine amidase AmpD
MTTTAKYYTKGPRKHPINLIVMHTMESQEKIGTAKRVALWFAGKTAPHASAHITVDNKDVVTVVEDKDIAWHAGQSDVNMRSLSVELAGQASQTKAEWSDPFSKATLNNAAKKVADWCKTYNIPVVKLTPAQVAKGGKGICGHADVTKGYAISGGHTDPGKDFPWDFFIGLVQKYHG